jgi:glutathione reductase (NADPH)
MSRYDYDLFVIGAGSGGVRAARVAAGHGARVAVAEEYRVGGTCVIRGCVPKKLLAYAAHFREDFEDARGFGWKTDEPRFDWPALIANKDREIDRLNGIYKKLLSDAKVALIESRAVLADPHTVEVGGKRVTAERILIATGARPSLPTEPGAEHGITSNEAFHLPKLPGHVTVCGGGYIACEFAGIFNGLGAKVTHLYRGEQILRGFDDDVRHALAAEMGKKGIDIRLNTIVKRTDKAGGRYKLTLSDGSTLDTDLVMYAIGRKPNTAGMGLEEAGVALGGDGAVMVDEHSQTQMPHIHAVGDCTNRLNLTPVAIREGQAFADTVFGGRPTAVDHHNVPHAVFSQPPVGSVGMTEAFARIHCGALDIYRTSFRPLKHTLSGRDEKTMMKLVVDRTSQRVVGVHMVGLDAPEIVQSIAIAVKIGATKPQFDATMALHPTAAEEFVTLRTPVAEPQKKKAAE